MTDLIALAKRLRQADREIDRNGNLVAARNHCLEVADTLDRLAASSPDYAAGMREGIYIASKTKHADRWRFLRDKIGWPIISTWIDEAGEGESTDLDDLWRRCLHEASHCRVLIAYREKGETFKGGWVEIGAALTVGIPVLAVGLDEFTIAKYRGIQHFSDMKSAIAASRKLFAIPVPDTAASAPAVGREEVISEIGRLIRCTVYHDGNTATGLNGEQDAAKAIFDFLFQSFGERAMWEALEDILIATRRHTLEVGFNHSRPSAKELQCRLDNIEQIATQHLSAPRPTSTGGRVDV